MVNIRDVNDKLDRIIHNDLKHISDKVHITDEKIDKAHDKIDKIDKRVDEVDTKVSFVRGQLFILVPIILAMIGFIVYQLSGVKFG